MTEKTPPSKPVCICIQDPYASLPPNLRPQPVQKLGGLRKVTCPCCSLVYWTNRKTDLCIDCEKKGIVIPEDQKGG
ncbi:MAG: hypothetical protein EHM81_00220 [Chloroflexi bacterium]|nr:MAG: hypothetical protein EHM81_00220 [Chloroflexota bacterium]